MSFPPEADAILQELFTHYPPCDGDTAATSFHKYSGHSGKQGQWKDDFFRKPQISSEEILQKVASMSSRLKKDKALQEVRNTLLFRCPYFGRIVILILCPEYRLRSYVSFQVAEIERKMCLLIYVTDL